jgi:hypothetical protein
MLTLVTLLLCVAPFAAAAFFAWNGVPVLDAFFGLIFLVLVAGPGGDGATRRRLVVFALTLGVLGLGVYRRACWQEKRVWLMLAAERVVEARACGAAPEEVASRLRRWEDYARQDPRTQVSVLPRDGRPGTLRLAIDVGFRHWWEASPAEACGETRAQRVVWRASGDDVDIVQKELDEFLAVLEGRRSSNHLGPGSPVAWLGAAAGPP